LKNNHRFDLKGKIIIIVVVVVVIIIISKLKNKTIITIEEKP
jgi:hypothetical protein